MFCSLTFSKLDNPNHIPGTGTLYVLGDHPFKTSAFFRGVKKSKFLKDSLVSNAKRLLSKAELTQKDIVVTKPDFE